MSIIVFLLIWYFIFGGRDRLHKDAEEKIGFIIVSLILLSVLGGLATVLLPFLGIIFVLGIPFIPFLIIIGVLRLISGKNRRRDRRESRRERRTASYETVGRSGLVKSASKRRRIIAKFSKKYNLFLSDKEIDRINDASYVSYDWEQEVLAMSRDYASVSEWYASSTGWLRAYFRAFSVQSVSSDFAMQKIVCLDSYAQIFDSMDMRAYANIDSLIDDINARYLTSFDEATFMIAYRFLEANGKKYRLPATGVLRYESELDRLKQKYDEAEPAGVGRGMPSR